ncbi:MAG: malto-oligosyltrehalose trehalohydrolase [Actinomycetota bacterium]
MTEISVWAPHAERVDLHLRDKPIAMRRDARGAASAGPQNKRGTWRVDASIEHGDDYGFSIDGGGELPDPRSPWQPRGVHGPSRYLDHGEFGWADQAWRPPPLQSSVIYELHAGTFTPDGTFEAVAKRLDHLVSLGVTALELMPVNEFPGERGWGYDGVDPYAPHHAYGGPDGLKHLVDACHARGLAVIVDVVYNHLGPAGNHLREFGPYFTEKYKTPWGDAVNFDERSSNEVRNFFIDNALMWLRDYHCDGLRIDAVHAMLDLSAVHFIEELTDRVRAHEAEAGRPFWVIAESDLNDPCLVRSPEAGGFGMDAQWSDDFHHALHALLTGERSGYYADFGSVSQLATALTNAYVFSGGYSDFRGRNHGRPARGLPGSRFLGYLQNHDQIGNRATGDRTSHLLSPGLLRVGAALVMTSPFVPLLFMGEEWGASTPFQYFTDHDDPQLGRAIGEGRRREFESFGWAADKVPDPQAVETFTRSKLNWNEVGTEPHAGMLDWHRRLIELRRSTPSLVDDDLEAVKVRYDEEKRWLVVERGEITVACNLGTKPVELDLAQNRRASVLLTSAHEPGADGDAIRLPAESVTIYSAG